MRKVIAALFVVLMWCSNAYAAERMLFYKVMVVNYETYESFKTKYYIKLDSATIAGKDYCKLKAKSKIKEACLLSLIWVISGKVKNVHDRGYQLTFGANKETHIYDYFYDGTWKGKRVWNKSLEKFKKAYPALYAEIEKARKERLAKKPEEKKPETGSIPNIANSKWKTTQIKNEWKIKPTTMSFLKNGKCVSLNSAGEEINLTCVWQQDYDELTFIYEKETTYVVKLSKNTWEGKAKNSKTDRVWFSYGEALVVESWLPGSDETQIVEAPDDEKIIIIGSGSGFFVSEQGHIVSNEHVVGVCKKVIAYEEGEEITLKILATDMVNDIGLVKGKFKNVKYLNIKTDGAELGEDIVAFGYPLSQTLSDSVKLTKGIVSSLTGLGNNISQIQIDAAIQPGNSGGPVLNMNGQVVGIASAGLNKLYMAKKADYIPENVNFAVASQTLTAFLKAHKVKVTSGPTRIYSTKELAKIGEPATIQLFCMNTKAEYAKLKKANKHSDVLLDLQ